MIGQKRAKVKGSPPVLHEPEQDGTMNTISAKKEIILLGANLQDNMGWGSHLETGEEAMIPEARKKLGILKHLGRAIPNKSRKLLVEWLVVSRIRYLVAFSGDSTDTLMRNTQTLLNDCARFATGRKGRKDSTLDLMTECSWMTVSELSKHSTLLLLWKFLRLQSPVNLTDNITIDDQNNTSTPNPRLLHTTKGFSWRSTVLWNQVPDAIRANMSYTSFKQDQELDH